MLKVIKETALRNGLLFSPNTFKIDFEIGMLVSIRETFGCETSIIEGCLLHFGQAIGRKVQHFGLIHDYNRNYEIIKTVRCIFSLALVPKYQVDYCWTDCCSRPIPSA